MEMRRDDLTPIESKFTQSQQMIVIAEDILLILERDSEGKDGYYYRFFQHLIKLLNKPHDLNKIARGMMPLFGGMGTFNDLVLHKTPSIPLQEENDLLAIQKNKLFLLLQEIINIDDLTPLIFPSSSL